MHSPGLLLEKYPGLGTSPTMQIPKDVTSHVLQRQVIQTPHGSSPLGTPSASPNRPCLLSAPGGTTAQGHNPPQERGYSWQSCSSPHHEKPISLAGPHSPGAEESDLDSGGSGRRRSPEEGGRPSAGRNKQIATQYKAQASRIGKRGFPSPCLHFVSFSLESSKPKTRFL